MEKKPPIYTSGRLVQDLLLPSLFVHFLFISNYERIERRLKPTTSEIQS